ncbi:tRNA lysidine(34) synthetase TilS [Staphylococcus edaphicus]|uniref:tRNA(Ile)-lysidine synthase n=1 Tax=Staphylococcus edaphicus TaxID=1955013 RepID=A0ABY4QDF8_9STAP|nr:tRNA lysidine(34) synthetase TilS [Staphylococcus edaphicus]UQW81303.1 tRNA lysidine(34) synthetase TilS [Staphylococcus edaphicus]
MDVNTKGWTKDKHIVLAVSTGVDSMVLLHELITSLKHSYSKLTCLHVNHNIRPIAKQEEAFLKQYCEEHEIELYVKHLDLSAVIEKGNSIENEARIARYQWFDLMMEELNADVLLTAHHQDDQIETIFYRLMTGRSSRSSLGMSYQMTREQYHVCKPLLTTTKSDIREYQITHDVPYYEDETNAQNHYVRNDIRNRILPSINKNKHLDTAQLIKLKDWHDEQLEVIDKEAIEFINHAIDKHPDTCHYQISRLQFLNLRYSVKMAVLDKICEKLQITRPITEKTYNEWFQKLEGNLTQCTLYTTDKWIIHIAYDKFIIMANYDVRYSPTKITHPGTYNYSHYHIDIKDDFPTEDFPLVIRTRRDGDKFKLNGVKGHKKISRLLIDYKIVHSERDQLPVIVNVKNEIIAVGTLYLQNKYNQLIFIRDMGEE